MEWSKKISCYINLHKFTDNIEDFVKVCNNAMYITEAHWTKDSFKYDLHGILSVIYMERFLKKSQVGIL